MRFERYERFDDFGTGWRRTLRIYHEDLTDGRGDVDEEEDEDDDIVVEEDLPEQEAGGEDDEEPPERVEDDAAAAAEPHRRLIRRRPPRGAVPLPPPDLSSLVSLLSRGGGGDYEALQVHWCFTGPTFWELLVSPLPSPPPPPVFALRNLEIFECPGVDSHAISLLARWLSSSPPNQQLSRCASLERLSIQYGFVSENDASSSSSTSSSSSEPGDADGRKGGIIDPILEALRTNTTLRRLTIRTGGVALAIGQDAARAVGASPTLETLTLSGMAIPPLHATFLALCLRGNNALRQIELASAGSDLPDREFHLLVRSHNWRLESVRLVGVPEESQRRIDRWTGTCNSHVRRVREGWDDLLASHIRRGTTAAPASGDPRNHSTLVPVLHLLPRVLDSLQSKPALVYGLLRERHLDELVTHWNRRRQPKPPPPPPALAASSRGTKGRATAPTVHRNRAGPTERRPPLKRRGGSGGGGGLAFRGS